MHQLQALDRTSMGCLGSLLPLLGPSDMKEACRRIANHKGNLNNRDPPSFKFDLNFITLDITSIFSVIYHTASRDVLLMTVSRI